MRRSTRWGLGPTWPALTAGLIVAFVGGPARAQFGYGWGWGMGYQTPAVVNSIYQRSNIAESAAFARRKDNLTAPARPTRDVTFFERYDPQTLQAMENRVARRPDVDSLRALKPPTPTTVAAAAPPAEPALGGFFHRYDEVVWPSDAPTGGDLRSRRMVSDQASLAVLKEYNTDGLAKIATVTDARNKLLDYGRPALEFVRKQTPGVADTFHRFLLSLYDALGRAATTPKK